MPTQQGQGSLARSLDALLARTRDVAFEVLVLARGPSTASMLRELQRIETLPHCRVQRDSRRSTESTLMHEAILNCSAEYVLLMSEHCEVTHGDWLNEMLGWCAQDGVGGVGAGLWSPRGMLLRGGLWRAMPSAVGHAHHGAWQGEPGDHGRAVLTQDTAACSSACLLIRRTAYLAAGGIQGTALDEINSDFDFGRRMRQAGWRMIWTPHAVMTLHPSVPFGLEGVSVESEVIGCQPSSDVRRHGAALASEPSLNPNLTMKGGALQLSRPPRVSMQRPWFEA
jgi:hypothetical protein